MDSHESTRNINDEDDGVGISPKSIEGPTETAITSQQQDGGNLAPSDVTTNETVIKQEPVELEDANTVINWQHNLPLIWVDDSVPSTSGEAEEISVHGPDLSQTSNICQFRRADSKTANSTSRADPYIYQVNGDNEIQGQDVTQGGKGQDVTISPSSEHDNPPYPVTLYHRWTTPEGNVMVGENVIAEARNSNGLQDPQRMPSMGLVVNIGPKTQCKPHICSMCDYRSARKSDLARHLKTHTDEETYTCSLCDYRCSTERFLVKHINTHGRKPNTCPLCDYSSVRKSDIITHIKAHTGDTQYTCPSCDYSCREGCHIIKHMTTHEEKPYACSVCDYRCSRKFYLNSHLRTHTGERPYKCSFCESGFTQRSSMVVHMRTHTGEKPHQCSACDYSCSRKSDLIIHMRSHSGEKPFTCSSCNYRCTSNSSLVVHIRTHTGESPHLCSVCGNSFTRRRNLVRHMLTHTGEKPHKCSFCDYSCYRKYDLAIHMKIH